MKKFLFSLLLLFFSMYGFCSSKQNYITLEQQNIRLKNFGFRLIGVINATSNKCIIGYVEKKWTYTKIPTFLKNDVDKALGSFIKKNLMPASADNDLIVRVNDLTVYETYSDVNETTIANVNPTFIFKENNRYYEKLTVSRHPDKECLGFH